MLEKLREQFRHFFMKLWPDLFEGNYSWFGFRYVFNVIIGHIVLTIVASLLGAAALSALAGLIVKSVFSSIPAFLFTFVIALCIVGGWLLWLYRRTPVVRPPPDDILVLARTDRIEYTCRTAAKYSRKIKLRALRDGIDRCQESYMWSGDKVLGISSSEPHHRIVTVDDAGQFIKLEIAFNETLRRGDEIEFTLTWNLEDNALRARPFLSRHIVRPTGHLAFEVQLYHGGYEGDAVAGVVTSATDPSQAQTSRLPFSNSGFVRWEIPSPRLQHTYELKWSGAHWRAAAST